ncbi:MAG: amidohydrolase family protein [Bacteroidales bacterium]|nr:amidohydrolase family protein [Bacteroidales bacterium]
MKEITFEFLFDPYSFSFHSNVQVLFESPNQKIIHIQPDSTSRKNFRHGFYTPGLINMHTHLEYSWMKHMIPPFQKMHFFIDFMKNHSQSVSETEKNEKAQNAIKNFKHNGIDHIVDICNTYLEVKTEESSFFTNLVEIFGIDPQKSEDKIQQAQKIFQLYRNTHQQTFFTPHSLYSLSDALWNYLLPRLVDAPFYSIHFMESKYEIDVLKDPVEKAISLLPRHQRVFFVHNTYTTEKDLIRLLDYFSDPWFVFCPRSNYYIEKKIPPIEMFVHYCFEKVLLGTDSLASNWSLNLWDEIRFLLKHIPSIHLTYWLRATTLSAAKALKKEASLGSIEIGKNPGIFFIPNHLWASL